MKNEKYFLYLKVLLTDTFVWAYLLLISNFIIYHRIILQNDTYSFSWNHFSISILIGFILCLIGLKVNFSLGKDLFFPTLRNNFFTPKRSYLLLVFIFSVITSIYISEFSIKNFFSKDGIAGVIRILNAFIHPNFEIFQTGLQAAIETIYMAFLATIIAIPIAFIVSFYAAANFMSESLFKKFLYVFVRFTLNISRSIEPLIWAIIFSIWVGIGPFSGMLALCIHSISSLTKQYSEQLELIETGPINAIKITGAHPIQVLWYGIIPQIYLPFLSFTIYRWDINVRMATIIGLVGGGGIGNLLMQYQGQARWNDVGMLLILISTIVWALDYLSSLFRKHLR